MSLIKREDIAFNILNGNVYCSSENMAKEFDKPHKAVMRNIKAEILRYLSEEHNLFKDATGFCSEDGKWKDFNINKIAENYNNLRGNILPVKNKFKHLFTNGNYFNDRGREYERFNLSYEGFQIIALGYSGKKARQNKRRFITGFKDLLKMVTENKEKSLRNLDDTIFAQFRNEGKEIRSKFTDAINDYLLPQRIEENKETSQFVQRYITSYTNLVYRTLGVVVPKGVTLNRDALDMRELFNIEKMESEIASKIKKYAEEGIHYKEIFKIIKKEIS